MRSTESPPASTERTLVAEPRSATALLAADPERSNSNGNGPRRRPGRPLEVSPDEVLGTIRRLSADRDGLFRVHLEAPDLYARARRLFGSWSAAVRRAGLDYEALRGAARARSAQSRRRNRRRWQREGERHPSRD